MLIFVKQSFTVRKSIEFYSHSEYECHSSHKGAQSYLHFILSSQSIKKLLDVTMRKHSFVEVRLYV